MKKLICTICVMILFAGCSSGISPTEYERVVSERDALRAELDVIKSAQAGEAAPASELDDLENSAELESSLDDTVQINDMLSGISAEEFIDLFFKYMDDRGYPLEDEIKTKLKEDDEYTHLTIPNLMILTFTLGENKNIESALGLIPIDKNNPQKALNVIYSMINVADGSLGTMETLDFVSELLKESMQANGESMKPKGRLVYALSQESPDSFGFMIMLD